VTAAVAVDALRAQTLSSTLGRFAMAPVAIAPEFQARRGDWNGRALTLHTEIFAGEGRLSRLHVASIEAADGSMASLTVLALPTSASGAPMFGADLVAFDDAFTTTILDVVPVGTSIHPESLSLLAGARILLERCGERRALGGEEPSPFSSHAAIVSPRRTEPVVAQLGRAYRTYLDVFVFELLRDEPCDPDAEPASRRAQGEFLSRLANVKKQMKSLSRLFGAEWTSAYFDRVFLSPGAIG
jgi:hypothetical protein